MLPPPPGLDEPKVIEMAEEIARSLPTSSSFLHDGFCAAIRGKNSPFLRFFHWLQKRSTSTSTAKIADDSKPLFPCLLPYVEVVRAHGGYYAGKNQS